MSNEKTGPQQIDDIVKLYGSWKGETLTTIRNVIKNAFPEVIEEVKWRMKSRPEGLPVWSHYGIVCIAETFNNDIKLVFFKGIYLNDEDKLFNARLKSRTDRAIEFREGSTINKSALSKLFIQAAEYNEAKSKNK